MSMDPYPPPHELLAFFEVEPVLADRDVPARYNVATFDTRRGPDRVRCEVAPGYGELHVRWERDGTELASVALRDVDGLTIEAECGREVLVAHLRGADLLPFRLQLRPHVHMFFGMRAGQ